MYLNKQLQLQLKDQLMYLNKQLQLQLKDQLKHLKELQLQLKDQLKHLKELQHHLLCVATASSSLMERRGWYQPSVTKPLVLTVTTQRRFVTETSNGPISP